MTLFSPFQRKTPLQSRIHIDETDAVNKVAAVISDKLLKYGIKPGRPRVIMCIGTDRSTGDSLGPIVGSKLLENKHTFFEVLGTLENPVHASNLSDHLRLLNQRTNPFVIAIDACLGNIDNVGYINIGDGALRPGAGVNKQLPSVGNLHITGVVNVGGFMEYFVLQNTRLNTVMKMARIISAGIHHGSKLLCSELH